MLILCLEIPNNFILSELVFRKLKKKSATLKSQAQTMEELKEAFAKSNELKIYSNISKKH